MSAVDIGAPARVNVLGVGISVLNMPEAIGRMERAARTPGFLGYVTVTGVHGVMESFSDEELRKIHNRSYLSTPDGMPMVWAGRVAGHSRMRRVYGPELMEELLKASPEHGYRHYFFGGAHGVAEELREAMTRRIDGLSVVGAGTPPFRPLTEEEECELAEDFCRQRPHYLWVGLSTPKQERFMARFTGRFPKLTEGWGHGLVLVGVGAAFDFHTGKVRQAPRWMQRSGLEWAFRLSQEPKRLWRRYFYNNPRFLFYYLAQLGGFSQYSVET